MFVPPDRLGVMESILRYGEILPSDLTEVGSRRSPVDEVLHGEWLRCLSPKDMLSFLRDTTLQDPSVDPFDLHPSLRKFVVASREWSEEFAVNASVRLSLARDLAIRSVLPLDVSAIRRSIRSFPDVHTLISNIRMRRSPSLIRLMPDIYVSSFTWDPLRILVCLLHGTCSSAESADEILVILSKSVDGLTWENLWDNTSEGFRSWISLTFRMNAIPLHANRDSSINEVVRWCVERWPGVAAARARGLFPAPLLQLCKY